MTTLSDFGLPRRAESKSLLYWFDNDENSAKSIAIISGTHQLDASTLEEGLHTVNFVVIGDDDTPYHISSRLFMKTRSNSSPKAVKMMYWYDDEKDVKETNITNGIQILDASSLTDGVHFLHYVLLGNDGSTTPAYTYAFLRLNNMMVSSKGEKLRFWFDDETEVTETEIIKGVQQIDVSKLPMGLHTIHYQILDNNGQIGIPETKLFYKEPELIAPGDKNQIVKYEYWVNSNTSARQTVTVGDNDNPYQLIGLLPISREPIRSTSFHFEVVEGTPMVYAKNDIYFRFHDQRGYFAQESKSFIDYGVSQQVTDIDLLESGIRSTIARPAANTIKWYKLNAETGDSLRFKLDRAASIQLFAPSGTEVYHESGSGSVKWGGLHTRESGVYYLALHDVTASSGTTISLDYEHIDKYAVLRQDVKVVGNGGCSTITFEGNGFQNLYAVDLLNDAGETIPHVFIGHESDATTTVVFDFDGCSEGQYNAVFHFADEDRTVKNAITVETARPTELETKVIYPSSFLRGSKASHKITIKNKGNHSAYRVPVHIVIKSAPNSISAVNWENQLPTRLADDFDFSELTESEAKSLRKLFEKIEKDPRLFILETVDEDGNPTEEEHFIESHVDIAPNSSVTLSLTTQAGQDISFACNVPTASPFIKTKKSSESDAGNWYCDKGKDAIDCAVGISGAIADIASEKIGDAAPGTTPALIANAVSCALDMTGTANEIAGKYACAGYESPGDQGFIPAAWEYLKVTNSFTSIVFTLANCAEKFLPARSVYHAINAIANDESIKTLRRGVSGVSALESCLKLFPNNEPYISRAVVSRDPNDIYGYTAESGSKAIRDGLTEVYYTIEFENDPKFATAAAHEIEVTDILDPAIFDLTTFAPTQVKIGDKTAELDGSPNFVTTIDMRPDIYAVAQVEGTLDEGSGMARWYITTLDPMTMEPTEDPQIGVLPVNSNGNGIGELSYDISLKADLEHATKVENKATIVFDTNDPIETPVWTNIIDKVTPESSITEVKVIDSSTAEVDVKVTDELSGPWRYDVYVQYGLGSAWTKAAENVAISEKAKVEIYEGINHGFYVVATDSAGNVEQKQAAREFTLETEGSVKLGDANGDGIVSVSDAVTIIGHILGEEPKKFLVLAADVNGDGLVTVADAVQVIDIILRKE